MEIKFQTTILLLSIILSCSFAVRPKGIKGELESLKGEMKSLRSELHSQQQTIASLEQERREQGEENRRQNQKIQNLKHLATSKAAGQQSEYACFSQIINLWCFDDGLIEITDAVYGMYSSPCEANCCQPDQVDDCRVSVSENNYSDWLSLKYTCDNRTSCSYEYLGSAIDECRLNYLADYLQVYYNCGDVAATYDPVGFTAYSTDTHRCDNSVTFDGVITNLGGYYSQNSSSFECPYKGVYMFSLSVLMAFDDDYYGSYDNYLNITLDNDLIAQVWADGDDITDLATAAGSIIIECDPGQVVKIGCEDREITIAGSSNRESLFSGYMLHRYEYESETQF